MQEYFGVLFSVCILSGIISVITPSESVKKYIEYICALCVISCMVLPIFDVFPSKIDIFDNLDDYEANMENYDEIYNSFWAEQDEKNAASALCDGLAESLSFPVDYFRVGLLTSGSGVERTLEGVTVYITDARGIAADPQKIRAYVKNMANTDCEIIYDFSVE